MTFSKDFSPLEEGEEFEASPVYPTVFGITLTPAVSGLLIAILGLAGGVYLLLNLVIPAWQKYQELQASREQKQSLVEQKQVSLRQLEKAITDLAQAKQQNTQVLALFATEKTLNTLLLDLNQVIDSGNAKLQANDFRAKLKRFVPVNQSGEVIADGSLGPEVNGKLKRRVYNVELQGTFEQTQSIIRNIERLQSFLIIKDFQTALAPAAPDSKGKVASGPTTITTSFQMQALVPATPAEAAAATAANSPKK